MNKLFVALLMSVVGITNVSANEVEEHKYLWNTLSEVGIKALVNTQKCNEDNIDGYYDMMNGVLVICQDNAKLAGSSAPWTENDFDTLRHEAHHVLQDCANGKMKDGILVPFYEMTEYREFVNITLTSDEVNNIVKIYREGGASPFAIVNEIEAFAVARVTSPKDIADRLLSMCDNIKDK